MQNQWAYPTIEDVQLGNGPDFNSSPQSENACCIKKWKGLGNPSASLSVVFLKAIFLRCVGTGWGLHGITSLGRWALFGKLWPRMVASRFPLQDWDSWSPTARTISFWWLTDEFLWELSSSTTITPVGSHPPMVSRCGHIGPGQPGGHAAPELPAGSAEVFVEPVLWFKFFLHPILCSSLLTDVYL